MTGDMVRAEVFAVVTQDEIEPGASAEGQRAVKITIACPTNFIQFLPEHDEVLVNFTRGYVRFRRQDFLRALRTVLPDIERGAE